MKLVDLIPYIGFEVLSVDADGEPVEYETTKVRLFLTVAWFGRGFSIGLK